MLPAENKKTQHPTDEMTLTFGYESPRDLLQKARRDLVDLEYVGFTKDRQQIGDAIHAFATTAYHIKDWLIKHRTSSYQKEDVENHVASSVALSSCRDICNALKHAEITNYEPSTAEVVASTSALTILSLGFTDSSSNFQHITRKSFRTKVVRKDDSRIDVVELAKQAIQDWESFFISHGLQI